MLQGLLTSVLPQWLKWQQEFCTHWQKEYEPHHLEHGFDFKTTPPRILPALAAAYHMRDYRHVLQAHDAYILPSLQ